MQSLPEKDKANLLAIADCARKILVFVHEINNAEDFYEDERTFDAVLMNFVVIGETVSRLSMAARHLIRSHLKIRLYVRLSLSKPVFLNKMAFDGLRRTY